MVFRPTDGADLKLFVEPHVEILAQEWSHPSPADSAGSKRRHHHLHLPSRHRRHHHFRLHAAHS